MKKKVRIAIAQLWQEQNTFSPVKTEIEDFEQYGLLYGSEIIDRFSDSNELGGFITELKKCECIDIIPTLRAWTWPKGNVSTGAYRKLKNDLISSLKKCMPLDGVLISFHGAMVSDDTFDIEGDILHTIHDQIAIDLPIAISCDLHANITEKMLEHAVFIEAYHTCPHVDLFRTGMKTASVFKDILINKLNLNHFFIKLPLITPARAHDSRSGPFKKLFNTIFNIENDPLIISASLFPVQPWLDVPELGWSVLVYSNSSTGVAEHYAKKIAALAWNLKDDFFVDELSPGEAMFEASKMKKGFMVVSDSDATTAGAPGDNTNILKEMIAQKVNFPALIPFIDREVVYEAIKAGKGNVFETFIGGKMDNIFSEPVKIKAKVISTGESIFEVDGHIGKNTFNMGKSSVLQMGNITMLVCEKNGPFYEPTVFRNSGLEPKDFRVVVVKSPVGFRDSYEKIADRIVLIKCPGLSSSDLNIFNFKNIPRPIYPLNRDTCWKGGNYAIEN